MKHQFLFWVAVVFAVFFVTSNPAGAARAVKSIIGTLAATGDSVGAFLTAVTS